MRIDFRAAWLPFGDGQIPDRVALAVDWIERECADQETTGVAVVSRKRDLSGYSAPLREFAARHEATTKRGSAPRRATPGPVLAYNLLFDDLAYAEFLARGSALCATEWPDVPLTGWAAARGALNLVTGKVTPRPSSDVVALLDRLHFAGNNGWFDPPGKRDAKRLLGDLHSAGPELDAQYVASYQVGLGDVSADSANHLLALASKVGSR